MRLDCTQEFLARLLYAMWGCRGAAFGVWREAAGVLLWYRSKTLHDASSVNKMKIFYISCSKHANRDRSTRTYINSIAYESLDISCRALCLTDFSPLTDEHIGRVALRSLFRPCKTSKISNLLHLILLGKISGLPECTKRVKSMIGVVLRLRWCLK